MISKWFELKNKAISLRKRGLSVRYIENKLGIPRSTLSGWFKDIKLSKNKKKKLFNNWKNGLADARKKAALWHIEDKEKRRSAIKQEIEEFTSDIKIDKKIGELMMAIFYLAEGGKQKTAL